jgi:hypothetical protein
VGAAAGHERSAAIQVQRSCASRRL